MVALALVSLNEEDRSMKTPTELEEPINEPERDNWALLHKLAVNAKQIAASLGLQLDDIEHRDEQPTEPNDETEVNNPWVGKL